MVIARANRIGNCLLLIVNGMVESDVERIILGINARFLFFLQLKLPHLSFFGKVASQSGEYRSPVLDFR